MVFAIKNDKKFKMLLPKKYYLMYKIGVSSGLRISDIVKLEKNQIIDNQRPTITAQKTGKKKRIFINSTTMDLIKEVAAEDKTNSKYLFPSPKDARLPITRQSAWKAFTNAAKKAGIEHAVGTHCMRKKYASKSFDRSKHDIFQVQKAMQHDNLADTALYLVGAKDDNR